MMGETPRGRLVGEAASGLEWITPSVLTRKRFLRFRWVLLLLFAFMLFSLGQHAGAVQKEQEILRAKTIEAETFELRRADGKQAAVLSARPGGEATLSFYDRKGSSRLVLGADPKGAPFISFFGEKNDLRMAISLDQVSHSPHVRLFDEHGNPQISLGVDDDLGPSLSVGNVNKTRVTISADKQGPAIVLYDATNSPRMRIAINENEPIVELLDNNRTARSTWRVRKDGSPEFAVADRASRIRLQLSSDANGKSSVRFLDANGHVTREIGE